jgi:hypothetical protein
MRKEFADLLGLIGTAFHNLKIREHFKIDCMTAKVRVQILFAFCGVAHFKIECMTVKERAQIPFALRGVPRHVNHSRLAFINKLGRRAEVPHDVHEGVVYHDSQIKRNKELLPHPDTDHCQFKHCAQ